MGRMRFLAAGLFLLVVSVVEVRGEGLGTLAGAVTGAHRIPLGGVAVVVDELAREGVTDAQGRYRFDRLPPGSYRITYTLGEKTVSFGSVEIRAAETTELNQTLDWDVGFADAITVYSASRRRENIAEAPAAVTVVTEREIEQQAPTGQLPRLFELAPGVEISQSGIYDFNLNTRGFNTPQNRRVLTLIDGRDPSFTFLMSPDWPSLAGMEDLASAELVRGPSSALYGGNAFNGVLNLTTKQPRYSQGGAFRLSGGELSTIRGDLRFAHELGSGFYLKATGSYGDSQDFFQSRCVAGVPPCPADAPGPEYPGLPLERYPLQRDHVVIGSGSMRLDKYLFANAHLVTVEGGYSSVEGAVLKTGNGQIQGLESRRPWARMSYDTPHVNLLGYYNRQDAPRQIALTTGDSLVLRSTLWAVEARTSWAFAGDRGQVAGGASYREEATSTDGTITFTDVRGDRSAAFAQADYAVSPRLRLVLAGRYDQSSLHDSQFSPKLGMVYAITPEQTLRLTYNEAFQSPNASELFLYAPTAIRTPRGPIAAVDLRGIEANLCTPYGVTCGFGAPVGVRVVGNVDLEVETIKAWEVGYTGALWGRGLLTLDYYHARLDNFVTDLIANPFGTVNPRFGPYQPPPGHPNPALLLSTLQGALGPLFGFLSTNPAGTPIFALASYTNAGRADTKGVDLGLFYRIGDRVTINATYSWFDFEIQATAVGDEVQANTPANRYSLGVSYVGDRWDASLACRWVEAFRWAAGINVGTVPTYDVVAFDGRYLLGARWSLGVNISNLLDNRHYEAFGGDVLGRRALAYVAYRW